MDLSSRKIKKYIREGYDLNLISRIQSDIPDFKYDDRYWRQANGYYKIAHVPYDRYPEHGLPDFWMSDLMLVDNVISFMSLEHASNSEMSELASKAISNMLATQNTKAAQDADDKMRISSLLDYREKLGNNVPSKKIHTRFLLAANTLEQLVEREVDLKQQLNQYSISSSDGMQDVEYHTAFIPASRLEDTPLRRKGQAASVWDLGAGYPFNHTNLMDTYGVYLGETRTGGVVNFDLLHEDRERKIPSMLIYTFVENSVKHHGVDTGQIKIEVSIQRITLEKKKYIEVCIEDNGQGFDKKTIDLIQRKEVIIDKRGLHHIGIYNIIQRLDILYENRAQIKFTNKTEQTGAVVIIDIPCDVEKR